MRLVNVLGGAVAVQQRRSRISRAPYNNQRPALLPSASKMVALYLSAHLCTLSAAHSAARLVCCPRWTAGNPHSHHTAAGHFMITSCKLRLSARSDRPARAATGRGALLRERRSTCRTPSSRRPRSWTSAPPCACTDCLVRTSFAPARPQYALPAIQSRPGRVWHTATTTNPLVTQATLSIK